MSKFRTVLLSAVSVAAFAATAHAAAPQIIYRNGTWAVVSGTAANNQPFCAIASASPSVDGRVLVLAASPVEGIKLTVVDDHWRVPASVNTTMTLQITGFDGWTSVHSTASNNTVATPFLSGDLREFIHEFTSGTSMKVNVTGTSDTVVSLEGTTNNWKPFMGCVNVVAPNVSAEIAGAGRADLTDESGASLPGETPPSNHQ